MFGEEPAGGFGADDESAADGSGGVAHGAVAVGPIDVFQLSVADDGDELILVPACLTAGHDGFDLGSDDWPYLGPALDAILSQRARMFVGPEAGAIGVVIELDEVFAPPEKHWVPGGEHGVDGDEQRFGPLLDWADRGLAPIERASEIGHLAGAEDKVLTGGWGSGGLLSVLLSGFYGHEWLLLHTGLRVRRSVASILCTSDHQRQFDVFAIWDGVKAWKGCLRRGF